LILRKTSVLFGAIWSTSIISTPRENGVMLLTGEVTVLQVTEYTRVDRKSEIGEETLWA
jgi:hypothetical protein